MVVIAITAILITLAVPSFARYMGDWQRSSAVNALSGSLNLARSEAIKSSRPVRLCVSSNQSSCASTGDWKDGWIVFMDINGNDALDTGEPVLQTRAALTGLKKIEATSNSPRAFTFMPNGLLKSTATTLVFEHQNSSVTQRQLVISRLGRVRVKE